MIRELDIVVLILDIKEHSLRKNDRGTAVHVCENHAAFEVEFMADKGERVALPTLTEKDIRPMRPEEI